MTSERPRLIDRLQQRPPPRPSPTPEEIEEERFRKELLASQRPARIVAAWLSRTYSLHTEVPELKIRPANATPAQRRAFTDKGDILAWKDHWPAKRRVEVKWRHIPFTCAEDFPFPSVNVDRLDHNLDALMFVGTNHSLTHAFVIHENTKPYWVEETSTDEARGYKPFRIYRCPLEHVTFVSLTPPPRPRLKARSSHLQGGPPVYRCSVCGIDACYGQDVSLLRDKPGTWFCAAHVPAGFLPS